MKDYMKLVFSKKNYIDDLCAFYGNPEDVRDHLLKMENKCGILKPLFSRILKKDIEKFNTVIEREQLMKYDEYNQKLAEDDSYNSDNACYDCPYSDGEGSCTIPSCIC